MIILFPVGSQSLQHLDFEMMTFYELCKGK